ncbi:MAG: MFS transporter [Muricoprocola sp.]
MKVKFEKYALLALSVILVSSYSISAVLPRMREYYRGYSADRVDLLISISSFAILTVMLVNIAFSRFIKGRVMIVGGLILFTVAGLFPLICQSYYPVLISRFLLGVGSGMVNTQAVSVISERYKGKEQTRLLGFRGAVEALGNAVLTFLAGVLLVAGWTNVFWIYAVGIPVLIVYLIFVPAGSHRDSGKEAVPKSASPASQEHAGGILAGYGVFVIMNACFCALLIGSNTVLTMRIPVFVVEKGLGTDTQASMILSVMIVASIVSGFLYSRIRSLMKGWFVIGLLLVTVFGMGGICLSANLAIMTVMAAIFGASYPILVTNALQAPASKLPGNLINRGTNCVLIGCNLGAFVSTYVIKGVSYLSNRMEAPVYLYGGVLLSIMATLLIRKVITRDLSENIA